jgi:hypothetical protein
MLEKFDIPFGRRFQLPGFAISIVLSVFKIAYSPQSYNVYNYFPNKRRFFAERITLLSSMHQWFLSWWRAFSVKDK